MQQPQKKMQTPNIAENINTAENQRLKNLCFNDLENDSYFGFGSKRISVDIEGTITEKYPFRAFGYKDEQKNLYVGMRKYYDQGDSFKIVEFDPKKTITNHIVTLIKVYEQEENNNKTNLKVKTVIN